MVFFTSAIARAVWPLLKREHIHWSSGEDHKSRLNQFVCDMADGAI